MADDNTIYPRFGRQQWHRRRRSVQGKDWAPPNAQSVHRGVWCPRCKVRHPYNGGKDRLVTMYEQRPDGWHTYWCCPSTMDVLGELEYRGKVDGDAEDGQDQEDDHDSHTGSPDELLGDDG